MPKNTALLWISSDNAENSNIVSAGERWHLDLKGRVHFLIAGVLPADVREHHLGI